MAICRVSNVLCMANPVAGVAGPAHRARAVVLVDAAQRVPHVAVNVQELGCDFLAFSSHKVCGPMGDLASLPLLERFGVRRPGRASCYLYMTSEEVEQFAAASSEIADGTTT